jgi:hypothetical protein
LKNTLNILDFGFSTLVRKGSVAKGLRMGHLTLKGPEFPTFSRDCEDYFVLIFRDLFVKVK